MKKLVSRRFKKTVHPIQQSPKKDQFPTFSRIIPALTRLVRRVMAESRKKLKNWKTKKFLITGTSIILLCIIGIELIQLYQSFEIKRNLDLERGKIITEIAFWKKITEQYSGYRDAYYKLALLEYQLNEKQQAKFYLQKALSIDPQFEQGRKLEKLLK